MKTSNLTDLQREYAEIVVREKAVNADKSRVKAAIEKELGQSPVSIETQYGKFTMVGRKKYEYSPAVERLTEDLSILKVEEEESGVATAEEVFSLRFNANKKTA